MEQRQKLGILKKVFLFIMFILGALTFLFILVPYFTLLPFNLYLHEYLLFTIFEILSPILFIASFVVFVFQVIKKKDKVYKWLLTIFNTFFLIIITMTLLLLLLVFMQTMDVQSSNQFEAEHIELYRTYQPMLNYLEEYKNKAGVYPDKIDTDKVKIKSKCFKKYKYKTSKDNKTYTIKVFPRKAFIKYYQYSKNNTQSRKRNWSYIIR